MKPEQQILNPIMDYLAARRILAFRNNTGAMMSTYKGKTRMMRFGVPGMSDIVAYPSSCAFNAVYWIEVKAPRGKQSDLQKSFQKQVEEAGHVYLLAFSVDDVAEALR